MGIALCTIVAIPGTVGTSQAISAQQKEELANKRSAKFYLHTSLPSTPDVPYSVILQDGGAYLASQNTQNRPQHGHPFTGYYFTYPSEQQYDGLVSTIPGPVPMLNWMFVDEDSGELRYGIKSDTLGHVIGPWGWTADDEMLTLEEDEEAFVAVWQEKQGLWQVFWDVDAEELDAPEEEVQEIRLRRRPLLGYSSKLVTKDHTK